MTELDVHFFDRPLHSLRRSGQFVLVMLIAMGGDLLTQSIGGFSTPGLFLLPAIAVLGMLGGMRAAWTGAAIAIAFAGAMDCLNGSLHHFTWDRLGHLMILCISAPVVATVVGILHRRGERIVAGQLRYARDTAEQRARTFEMEKATLLSRTQLSQQRANDLIGSIPGVVWETDLHDGSLTITFISSYVEQLLGFPLSDWTRQSDFWIQRIHPDDRSTVLHRLKEICDESSDSAEANLPTLEFRWLDQQDQPLWVETRLIRLMKADRCVGFRAVTLDINTRKQLEQNLRNRAAEQAAMTESLKRSNEALDQFAYVTSHDLKAPLRGICNLSHWIEEDLGDNFTPHAREQMQLLRGRVHRMEALINGLLEYSHVGRTRGVVQRVDAAQLAAEVIDWIGPPAEIHIEVQPGLPVFDTDRLRLQQVFSNLLGNAVKHHGAPAGHISVRCDDAGDFFKFSVTDDGQGIDPRYHERIFGIFQTLVPRDQLEGTGIGLSLVKKIVESKGGTVSVQSQPGKGATFGFTWPKSEQGASA